MKKSLLTLSLLALVLLILFTLTACNGKRKSGDDAYCVIPPEEEPIDTPDEKPADQVPEGTVAAISDYYGDERLDAFFQFLCKNDFQIVVKSSEMDTDSVYTLTATDGKLRLRTSSTIDLGINIPGFDLASEEEIILDLQIEGGEVVSADQYYRGGTDTKYAKTVCTEESAQDAARACYDFLFPYLYEGETEFTKGETTLTIAGVSFAADTFAEEGSRALIAIDKELGICLTKTNAEGETVWEIATVSYSVAPTDRIVIPGDGEWEDAPEIDPGESEPADNQITLEHPNMPTADTLRTWAEEKGFSVEYTDEHKMSAESSNVDTYAFAAKGKLWYFNCGSEFYFDFSGGDTYELYQKNEDGWIKEKRSISDTDIFDDLLGQLVYFMTLAKQSAYDADVAFEKTSGAHLGQTVDVYTATSGVNEYSIKVSADDVTMYYSKITFRGEAYESGVIAETTKFAVGESVKIDLPAALDVTGSQS